MDQACTIENFITMWNERFPNHSFTTADLKKPHAVMGAVFQIFDCLDVDRDAILKPPPEDSRNENIIYYWDLLPVINTMRVVYHLLTPQVCFGITIANFLQPSVTTSHSILLLMYNLMLFKEGKMQEIGPYEEELFSKTDKVKILKDREIHLKQLLNERAVQKAERGGRIKRLDAEIKQYEEELKQEKEACDKEKQELEAVNKEHRQLHMIIEQKKVHRDGLIAEVEKKRALRVYDADDIKAQVEQTAQNVQDAEENLNALRTKLMQKESSLKNLQSIKPNLDIANNLLYEITKLSDSLRDYENCDLESNECEQGELNAELSELEAQLVELTAARAQNNKKRQENNVKRLQERSVAQSNLREAEDKDKRCEEKSKKATQQVVEIKQMTDEYEKEKAISFDILRNIKESFVSELNSIDGALLKKALESKEKIEGKLQKRNG